MNQIRIITYGILLGSLAGIGLNQKSVVGSSEVSTESSNLVLVANGEDFVRQGFVSKDGWQINFDHVYVNISDAIAYSTESAFEPQKGDRQEDINYLQTISRLSAVNKGDR